MAALDVPVRGSPAKRKPTMGKANRRSIEVFGGAPRLVQAGVYGASSALQQQDEPSASLRTASFTLPAITPADGEPLHDDDADDPSALASLRHSGRKLADIERSFAERTALIAGLAPRTTSQSVRRGDAVFELTGPPATAHELLMAERAAQWGVVLRSSQPRPLSRRSEEYRVRRSGDFPRSTHRRFSEDYKKSDYIPRARPALSRRNGPSSELAQVPVRVSPDLVAALSSFKQTFVVSDATKPDYPIVYASAGFFSMTGYSAGEVIGRNCRFLQGPDTDLVDVDKIRQAVKQGRSFCGRLLNYRKDGSAFWNLLTISPIKDDNDKVIKFIGMQVEVSKYTEGAKEKARRPNGLPESLIRYDARQRDRATESVTELVGAFKRPSPGPETALERVSPSTFVNKGLPHRRSIDPQAGARGDVEDAGFGQSRKRASGLLSLIGLGKTQRARRSQTVVTKVDGDGVSSPVGALNRPDEDRALGIRRGIDLATTLERIEKNFVITDPRLPDNPIIFASDAFLELTEYTREEILGRNCRFLQGPDTDRTTVQQIRDAIKQRRDITVQLLNYTKSGKPFWNLFHLQAMRDHNGELQYFIGVQLDGSEYVEPDRHRLSDNTERKGAKQVRETARNVDVAVRELPDANTAPDDLWLYHSRIVFPKPHMDGRAAWQAMIKVRSAGQRLGLKHFKPIKPLGCGDTGSIHLVELRGTNQVYAMKAMDKMVMLDRNKVHRACAERQILDLLDHPLLPTLYASFQTATHLCLITDFCPGGELYMVLDRQPEKQFREESARFYAAEVVLALEYLHCRGVVYRDLKPENILVTESGHVQLTDFDLSFMTSSKAQLIRPEEPEKKVKKSKKNVALPVFFAEPAIRSNSFVGTEEYIAPEVISAQGHSSAVDWWGLGILLYEMLFGRTPFRGKNRQKTFANILKKELYFPSNVPVSIEVKLLIQGLLIRDPLKRLGSHRGANDVKSHPFFRGIKWSLVRHMSPPPLEVPLRITSILPEVKDKGVELEWDDLEAATAFSDTF